MVISVLTVVRLHFYSVRKLGAGLESMMMSAARVQIRVLQRMTGTGEDKASILKCQVI